MQPRPGQVNGARNQTGADHPIRIARIDHQHAAVAARNTFQVLQKFELANGLDARGQLHRLNAIGWARPRGQRIVGIDFGIVLLVALDAEWTPFVDDVDIG